jgi:PII-like signaling protein
MQAPQQAVLLRIFTSEGARDGGRPLYEAIIRRAREAKLAGATVLRGPMGFGASAKLHNASIIDLAADLPLVIEIVDSDEKLRPFAAALADLDDIGLVTFEKVEVVHYGRRQKP